MKMYGRNWERIYSPLPSSAWPVAAIDGFRILVSEEEGYVYLASPGLIYRSYVDDPVNS